MINLPHGCWMSDPSVNPSNWKQVGANTDRNWYIQYWFHDPAFRNDPKFKHGKLRIIKGMNRYVNLAERRDATQTLIDNEIRILREEGFNPITNKFTPQEVIDSDIDPGTTFIMALKIAHSSLTCSPKTKADIKGVMKHTELEAIKLNYDHLPVVQIRKKHIKTILLRLSKSKKIWNPNQFNVYRKYLGILFNELMEYIDLEYNPAMAITKQKSVKRIRKTLTPKERTKIDTELRESNFTFWRLIHIFFHSGARESELMLVKAGDVDLAAQKFKVTILKGKNQYETWKPIKDIALPLWEELLAGAGPDQYLFSKGLQPGDVAISANQISRRWLRHVKIPMDIEADFYSLKHLNLDETAAALSIEDAAKAASHTTPVITMDYAVGEKERQMNRLKKVNNAFS